MTLYLRDDLAEIWKGRDPFAAAATQTGEIFREREGRRTLRFSGEDGDKCDSNSQPAKTYFLKYHGGIGWGEIVKNISQAKWPIIGAMSEVHAIRAVEAAGVDTLTIVGYGERGADPAKQQSFLVTEDLVDTISLEELGEAWRERPGSIRFKRALIRRVAQMAKAMHDAGVNHRDFYLGHFLIAQQDADNENADAPIFLIDLHRSQVRGRVPRRWRVKDVGGLYFSTARFGLTLRDLFRFTQDYTGMPLREALRDKSTLLMASRREGEKIYRRYFEKEPNFPLQFSEHPGKDI
jgi:heptose I phosphotransferase